ncbi:MAG: hypothetical protein KC657_12710 [Myxococcales bacterium]|nr:hypothetical protein [Myxococcales bacterium]
MKLSRRQLLKAAMATGGAAAGARALGPLGQALAAPEPAHFVHIFFNGGLNALFAGNADKFLTSGTFGVSNANIKQVGSGVFTDATTFGTFPQLALDHWAAIGVRHGNALHTTPQNLNSGGERAMIMDGADCFLNQLAFHMGGDSAFKAVYFGDRAPAYREQKAFNGVPLQRVSDLSDAIKALGAQAPDADAPSREHSAAALEAAQAMSARQIRTNPGALAAFGDAITSAVGALRKPLPPPVTFAEIDAAYGLGQKTAVDSFASMLAGAEIMIRAAGTNVVNITDFGLASWDFHQTSGGASSNGTFSRQKFLGTGGFRGNRIAPIKTFLERMLALQDRNVVVCVSGELVRLPSGDHGNGTVAALFGKYVKQGVSFPVSTGAAFSASTPGPKAFWAAVAAACKVPGQPFGANPHPLIV